MKELMAKRRRLLKELMKCSNFVRGSINGVCAKCSRSHCICEVKTAKRAYRLTYKNREQKTRIVYIPEAKLPKIKIMIVNYSKSRKITEQIIETNIQIFKKENRRS